ncbi:MAG: DNA integrity scanning protein DisA nucleotide-binding domain protein [Candidatus Pacearchaeota archaeon]|nr:DNA integrity scanning protein DisA nucleotide-binding domain protein [Candidatus Pacearchaeota archaeon]
MVKKKIKAIEEKILKIALEIAKKGDGALFVIGKPNYSLLVKQEIKPFNVLEPGTEKTLKAIATIDGAVIINENGLVVNYGAMIKKTRPFLGYGTRHAAAITASKNKNLSILCSEEEHKVKVFKNGKFIMQIDALQKNVEKDIPRITTFLESIGAGFVGTVGVATLAPTLGITLIPGVLIFGGSYLAIKAIIKRIKVLKR